MKNYLLIFLSICVFSNLNAQLFGGQIKTSINLATQYPVGSVFCVSGPTGIVEVTNPTTGKTWMDRNLGASQVATSSTDAAAYGDLYQWGRRSDGHQCRTSPTTSTLSSSDQPAHGDFIINSEVVPVNQFDWRLPSNDNLWQGVSGINNPCPTGFRLPSITELDNERTTWSSNDQIGAFNSILKLPITGLRYRSGNLANAGSWGCYWSSSRLTTPHYATSLTIYSPPQVTGNANVPRADAQSVRCIKN